MHESNLVPERHGAVQWLRWNRPHAMNSIDTALAMALHDAIDEVGNDPSIRCVVITGTGRGFCAGGDLGLRGEGIETSAAVEMSGHIARMLDTLAAQPIPVIAAVNGTAFAGGIELLACCDIVVSVDTARFGDGHARWGLIPGAGGTARLPRIIGISRAKYFMMTDRVFDAATLRDWGLVHEVVAAEHLIETVEGLSNGVSVASPLALRSLKRLANSACERSLRDALEAEQADIAWLATRHDMTEGLAAFAEKRVAVFGNPSPSHAVE